VRLIEMAFRSLGPCPTLEDLEAVARDLREHGKSADLGLFEPIDGDEYAPVSGRLGDVAERCGSDRFSALDLLCEVRDPGSQRRVLERRPRTGRPSHASPDRGLTRPSPSWERHPRNVGAVRPNVSSRPVHGGSAKGL